MRTTDNKKSTKQQSVSSLKTRTKTNKEEYGQEKVNNPNRNQQRAKNCSTKNCSNASKKSSNK